MKWVNTGHIIIGNKKTKPYERWSCTSGNLWGYTATILYSRKHGYLDAPTSLSCGFVSKERLKGMSLDEAKAYIETLLRLEGFE